MLILGETGRPCGTVMERTVYEICCPHCGEGEHGITHLLQNPKAGGFGPWWCDACGGGFSGTFTPEGLQLQLLTGERKKIETLNLLRLDPGDKPLYCVVKGLRFSDAGEDQGAGYYYEEHTCPTNVTQSILTFIQEDDADPHGIFRYVDRVDEKESDWDTRVGLTAEAWLEKFQRRMDETGKVVSTQEEQAAREEYAPMSDESWANLWSVLGPDV